jgi:hypothetical protein
MSSSSGKRLDDSGEEHIPAKLLDLIEPKEDVYQADSPASAESVNHAQTNLQTSYGNAAVAHTLIQRKPDGEEAPQPTTQTETSGVPDQSVTRDLIVDDSVDVLEPGQMKKTQFLTELKEAVCLTASQTLAGTPWSATGCPYIDGWFAHYASQSSNYVEKAARRYAPEAAASTNASAYISAIVGRVQRSVTTWAATGEITGIPPGALVPAVLTSTIAGGLASAADTAAGVVSGVASTVSSGIGSAVSGIQNVLFKEDEGGAKEPTDPNAVEHKLGAGQTLEAGVRARMEQAFGESFSDVHVHTDTTAAQVSENLNARALTVGDHIAFGQGEYKPGNPIGDALVAHELAHVLQQRGSSQTTQRNQVGPHESTALEEAADQSAVSAVVAMWGGSKLQLGRLRRTAMPRLRSGLQLSRCPKKDKPTPGPDVVPADPHAEYEKRLKEAVDKLQGVSFGLCYEGPEKFDIDYWIVKDDPDFGRKLVLKSGKRPSDAIDSMFADLSKWRVDCAQFVQVAEWYALRHAYGADEFNKKVGSTFELRVHRSTGIKYKEAYDRPDKRSKMRRFSDGGEESKSVDQLVADAPIGSRIMWTNKRAPESSAFHNENTIKLGPDQFAAHGFGGGRNIFTRAEVELKLAQAENSAADAAYIAENIFIAQIGYFETP